MSKYTGLLWYALELRAPLRPGALGFHSANLACYQTYNTLDTLITINY
jgi:hypothetical protein